MLETALTGTDLPAKELLGFALPPTVGRGQEPSVLADVGRRLGLQKIDWKIIAPCLMFDARQYRRVRLFRDEAWEGILLCWLPGQRTTIHDHGGATGVSQVLFGGLHETRYAWDAPGMAPRACGSQALVTGEVSLELVETIHSVANESHFPAASLHLYSPPLRTLGAYDVEVGMRREIDVSDTPVVQVGGDPRMLN